MLALSSLNKLLGHVLSPPALHTAVLFTASGALVSYATTSNSNSNSYNDDEPQFQLRPKDDIRVLVGLASEVWAETKEDGEGMVDSELGRIIVLPIVPPPKQQQQQQDGGNTNSNSNTNINTNTGSTTSSSTAPNQQAKDSALLIALNATDDIEWGDLQHKAQSLAAHLAKPLQQVQAKLDTAPPLLSKSGRR